MNKIKRLNPTKQLKTQKGPMVFGKKKIINLNKLMLLQFYTLTIHIKYTLTKTHTHYSTGTIYYVNLSKIASNTENQKYHFT